MPSAVGGVLVGGIYLRPPFEPRLVCSSGSAELEHRDVVGPTLLLPATEDPPTLVFMGGEVAHARAADADSSPGVCGGSYQNDGG